MIEIVADSVIDHRDSAFPTVIQMDNGDLVCGFSVSGGPEVTGGTDFARSSDQGETWRTEGTVLPAVPVENGRLVNTLRLSRTPDNRIIAYGQVNRLIGEKTTFGQLENYAVWTRTSPGAFDFAPPVQLPKGKSHNLEVSNPIVVTDDGRFLAPAAYLPAGRFGEEVIVRESVDGGENWNGEYTVFADP